MNSNFDNTGSSSSSFQKVATHRLTCDALEKQMHEEAESQGRTMNNNSHSSQTHSPAQHTASTNSTSRPNYGSIRYHQRQHSLDRPYRRNSLPGWQRPHSETHMYRHDYQQEHPTRNHMFRNNSANLNPYKYVVRDKSNWTSNSSPQTGVISHLELESRHIEQMDKEENSKGSNSRLYLDNSKANIATTSSESTSLTNKNNMVSNATRRSSAPIYHGKGREDSSDSVFIQTTHIQVDDEQDKGKHGLKRRHYSETTQGASEHLFSSKKIRRASGSQPFLSREECKRSTSPRPVELPFTIDSLTEEIRETSKSNIQSPDLLEKKQRLRSVLEDIFKQEFPGCSLHLVGSSVNGFGNQLSDADFCLMLTQWREIDQRSEARNILVRLNQVLKICRFVKNSHVIFATVPIIKFVDRVSNCECDININNHVGIRNTFLLKAYCLNDERVRPLVIVVKKWAKTHGINDAKNGTLSSYALTLMVIHYLQCGCSPPVLPSLQNLYPGLFREDGNVNNLLKMDMESFLQQNRISRAQNTASLGELLLGFFQYFANTFKWDTSTLSVRLGRSYSTLIGTMKKKYIYIEEPFDSNNVAKTVYDEANFRKIKMKINLAANKLKVSPSLKSIL